MLIETFSEVGNLDSIGADLNDADDLMSSFQVNRISFY